MKKERDEKGVLKSERKIANELGIDRGTVRRHLIKHNQKRCNCNSSGGGGGGITQA